MRSSEFAGRSRASERGPGQVHLFVSQQGQTISSANSMFSSLCSVISDRCNAQARPLAATRSCLNEPQANLFKGERACVKACAGSRLPSDVPNCVIDAFAQAPRR